MTIVRPSGNPDARIAIVGARPGRDETYEGMPFVGASGHLLWKLLGVSRGECYVTNVRRDYSESNPVPTPAEITEALPALREELASCGANVFVALGAQALLALTGKHSIESYRGSVLESTLVPGRKVLATWHPAACLRTWPWTYILEHDLRRARREANHPDIRRPKRDFIINADLDTTINVLDSLGDNVSVDIETYGESVACVGLSDSPHRAICIPFIGGSLSTSQLSVVWRKLDHIFRTRGIIGQNIQFDTTRLERLGFRLNRIHFDTMLAHHLLWPEFAHDLGFIVSIYTDEPYYKDEIRSENRHEFYAYNCKDAACTYEAAEGLERELDANGQSAYYREHVLSLIRPVMAMQSRGFAVDFGKLHSVRTRTELEAQLLQLQFNAAVGFDCNVRSTTDMRYLIGDVLKLRGFKYTKGGKPATDEETLRTLAFRNPEATPLKTVLEIRKRRTLVSGFLNIETDKDDRYKANYLIHGTDSGRLSSRAARKGPQLQNVPKKARAVFRAQPGSVLVQGDLRRAEAMFVAYDAGEERLIELFADSTRDLYREIAASALGISLVEVEPWQREVFKKVVHASNYGMGANRFIVVLRLANIDIEDLYIRGLSNARRKAEFLIESYHSSYPRIRLWQREIRDIVSRTRTLHDAFGRQRKFLDRMEDSLFRAAFSFRPQGTIVGVTNRALRLATDAGEAILAQVHDSLVGEVRCDDRDAFGSRLRGYMTHPIRVKDRTMLIPVELQYGDNWYEMQNLEVA